MNPIATVWCPSYNHARFISATIESVLAQTLRESEIVVADDGSTDGTREIAESYAAAHPDRVRVVTHPGNGHRGVAETANLSAGHARGRYIAGLASDDMLYPDSLERRVDHLDRHPRVGLVYGYAHLVDDEGRSLPGVRAFGVDLTRGGRTLERLVQSNQVPGMTIMLRRECLDQIGGQDSRVYYTDWEMWIRAAATWDVGFIPHPLALYRIHGGNTGYGIAREIDLDRSLEVVNHVRDHSTPAVGGRLLEPRVRAALELQRAYYHFLRDEHDEAAAAISEALARDPGLRSDGRWLTDWLRERTLDLLTPEGTDLSGWVIATLGAHLEGRALAALRRGARVAALEARAARAAAEGDRHAAGRAALGAVARSPRLLADRRLATALVDSLGGGGPGTALRRVKRRVLGYR